METEIKYIADALEWPPEVRLPDVRENPRCERLRSAGLTVGAVKIICRQQGVYENDARIAACAAIAAGTLFHPMSENSHRLWLFAADECWQPNTRLARKLRKSLWSELAAHFSSHTVTPACELEIEAGAQVRQLVLVSIDSTSMGGAAKALHTMRRSAMIFAPDKGLSHDQLLHEFFANASSPNSSL